MKNAVLFLLICLSLHSCRESDCDISLLESGVPLALAAYRNDQVSNVVYTLSFSIPLKKETPISSKLKLELEIKNLEKPLYLDFKERTENLQSLSSNGKKMPIRHEREHIIIPSENLQLGKNQIEIDFLAGELSLNRNDEFLYTLLVPDRARTLFPCFDQPNIKAKYNLTVTAPENWSVLCGAAEENRYTEGEFVTHYFGTTDKMSTYLFSFVAGMFESATQNQGQTNMTLLYRENDAEKITYSTDTIFRLHQQAISFLEDYTAYIFPFQKLDFATIPGFQYGGMEHIGAIQYREDALFLDQSATENQKLLRAKLIAHETAHMWFGDLVTMEWFNDVWMKEVFANFMADKIVNPAFSNIDHKLAFMTKHYPRAYDEDRTKGTNPIRQELKNLNDAGSLYGSIIYNKAPIMMRQLEVVMGEKDFQQGLRQYIKAFENGNANWNDLITILDQKTSSNLEEWSKVWVNQSGRPLFSDRIKYDANDKIQSFEIFQKAEDEEKGIWPQTFDIALMYADTVQTISVNSNDERIDLKEAIGLGRPKTVIYNANGMGYGVFPIDTKAIDDISHLDNLVTRGYVYINGYENALNGTIPIMSIFDLFRKGLLSEKNTLLAELVSRYMRSIFWNYLTETQRTEILPSLEKQLMTQLRSDLPSDIKKNLFQAFRSVAYSDSGKAHLYRIWNKETIITGLRLNEDDYTDLAMSLSLYAHQDQAAILIKAKSEISNPDKLKRFEFLLPSLSTDVTVRDSFIETLKHEKNREKEAWVLDGLGFINHPTRQDHAIKYLKASLELLGEIQRTGDIFFPKGWLNGTIGSYTSVDAYQILEEYLAAQPDLNPALLKKILQASDDLRRNQVLHKRKP